MSQVTTRRSSRTGRQIGPWGTVARVLIGTTFIIAAGLLAPSPFEVFGGLVVAPAAVTLAVLARGRSSRQLRLHGTWPMVLNTIGFFAFLVVLPSAGALFYGVSMLIAATVGLCACEVMVASNVILGRDDQLGCPVFSPIDRAEGRLPAEEMCR